MRSARTPALSRTFLIHPKKARTTSTKRNKPSQSFRKATSPKKRLESLSNLSLSFGSLSTLEDSWGALQAGLKREEALSRLENRVKQTFRVGKLNLVDLAGSERVRVSGASGQRASERRALSDFQLN